MAISNVAVSFRMEDCCTSFRARSCALRAASIVANLSSFTAQVKIIDEDRHALSDGNEHAVKLKRLGSCSNLLVFKGG